MTHAIERPDDLEGTSKLGLWLWNRNEIHEGDVDEALTRPAGFVQLRAALPGEST